VIMRKQHQPVLRHHAAQGAVNGHPHRIDGAWWSKQQDRSWSP
jgi:hypothetical protein